MCMLPESSLLENAIRTKMYDIEFFLTEPCTDLKGGTGGPDAPGKSQVRWVSIGNLQLDPHRKKLDHPPPPPPLPGKCWT